MAATAIRYYLAHWRPPVSTASASSRRWQRALLEQSPARPLPQHVSTLEGWREVIETMHRRRAGPRAIFDRLRLEHPDFPGSLSAVKRLCARLTRERGVAPEDVAIPVETEPGAVAQVDFT